MLTPSLIKALNQATGGKVNTTPSATSIATPARLSQLTTIANNGPTPKQSSLPSQLGDVTQPVSDFVTGTNAHAANIVGDLTTTNDKGEITLAKPSLSGAADVIGNVAGVATDILGTLFKIGYNVTTPPVVKNAISAFGAYVAKNHADQTAAADASGQHQTTVQDLWQNWATKNPDQAKTIAGIAGGASLGLLPDVNVGDVAGVAGQGVKTAAQMVADAATGAVSTVADTAVGAKNLVTGAVDTSKTLINGKTIEEVLATPENQVYKLSPTERSAYFDAKQTEISTAKSTADAQVKANLSTQATASQNEADALNKQLQTASRDKVLELRPKIRSAMAEQSATYRNLVDEAIAPVKDTPVKAKELASFVDNKFPDNPDMATAIKNKLGLNDKTTTPLIGDSGKFEVPTGDTTVGKIYEQTKSLKQDISAGAKGGSKVFTPDDKLTDDAISTLSDYMKSKGVDLSAANKFWAQYAPVRNQLVTEAKPFLQAPTQTKTFANTLLRVAKGTDVNNENFISQVEDLVGEPVTAENKAILSKLSENEKTALANETAAQEKLLENKTISDKARSLLGDKEFEASRLAQRRTILRRIFYTAGGLGIDKIIKKYTGIGF